MVFDRLEKVTNCLLQASEDNEVNICRLTALCGELLGATFAIYNRLEGNLLCSRGQWQTPQDYKPSDLPEGHICYDVITGNSNEVVLIRDLPSTHYAETDPNVRAYSLQTCLGQAVISEGKAVGSLCLVYQTDFIPADDDEKILGLIASAIGHEDARLKSKEALDRSVSLLKESEEKYRALIEATDTGFVILDKDGVVTDANAEYVHLTGHKKLEEILGKSVIEWTANHDLARNALEVQKCFERGFVRNLNIDYVDKHGQITPIEINATVVNTKIGPLIVTICRDITERKQTETALWESEEHFRSMMEQYPLGMQLMTPDGRTIKVNRAWEKIWGITLDDLKEYNILQDAQLEIIGIMPFIKKGFSGEPTEIPAAEYDAQKTLGMGARRWVRGHIYPVKGEKGDIRTIVLLHEDITEQKNLEEQFQQAQKMEAVGQLAGGIAHDFNNILSAIIGYGHLLKSKMGDDKPLTEYLEQILESATRATEVTRSLLAFSRQQVINPKPINMNAIVRQVETLLSRFIREDIEIVTELTREEEACLADGSQMEQVLINLATNARDAMPRGGQLTIKTECFELDDTFIQGHGYGKPGKYILIRVSDTGIGLTQETASKIFEPFFTTKEVGKGTGLGLSMVYGIIKQHDGYIEVESEPDKGTSFNIYLPTTDVRDEAPATIKSDAMLAPGRSETILVAEDNEQLSKLFEVILTNHGYKVILASDGEAASRKFIENSNIIQLAVLDMIMPKKSGREVYEEIKRIKPEMKVLFLSGYTADRIDHASWLHKDLNFLSKPVSPQSLLLKIAEMLRN